MLHAKNNVLPMRENSIDLLPPQSVEIEKDILGCILVDPEAIALVQESLPSEAFYLLPHQRIYQACLALWERNVPVDLRTVESWLADNKLLDLIGGQSYLVDLVSVIVSTSAIPYYAQVIVDKWKRRRLIEAGHKIVRLGYEVATELETVSDESEQVLFRVTQQELEGKVESPAQILNRVYEEANKPRLKGVLAGIPSLDEMTGGFKKNQFCIVAGRTGMGKTHFLISLAVQALKRDEPVLFFSAEMSRDQLMTRMLAWESGVDAKKIENGKVPQEEYEPLGESVQKLSNIPLHLDDTSGSALTPNRIQSSIRAATARLKRPPKLILIDYIQLLGSDNPQQLNRVRELDLIARKCKEISGKFGIPVIAAAQISRRVEERSDKRPTIADLREAGGLENESDMIILLYRDDYYNRNSPEKDICEVILAKQRSGITGTIKTICDLKTSRFKDLNSSLSYDSYMTNTTEERF